MNKRTGLSVLFLVMASMVLQAQDSIVKRPPPTFKLGVAFMPQTTYIYNSSEQEKPYLSRSWRQGLMYGLTSGLVFNNEKFSVDFGLLYSTQGVVVNNPNPFYTSITLKYLKIPLTLNYYPLKKHNIPLVISGGFQVSNLVKATIDMPKGYFLLGDDKQWFNSNIIDVVVAIGFDFPVSKKVFLA